MTIRLGSAIRSLLRRSAESSSLNRKRLERTLRLRWRELAGDEIADLGTPDRLIRRGDRTSSLHLIASEGRALELRMALPALAARLAAAFGSPVADEILIRPRSRRRGSSSSVSAFAPLAPLSRRRLRRLTASEERRIDGVASGVSHVRLRESLRRLGRSVVAAETEAETEVSLTSASEGATARRGVASPVAGDSIVARGSSTRRTRRM